MCHAFAIIKHMPPTIDLPSNDLRANELSNDQLLDDQGEVQTTSKMKTCNDVDSKNTN
jgi:hypothetical protein